MPANGIPPSRLPGPPAASGAALTVLTGIAAWLIAGAHWPRSRTPAPTTCPRSRPHYPTSRRRVHRPGTAAEQTTQPTQPGQGLGGRRRRRADQPQGLGHLHTEVAHTDTEVRQTLGVVEEAGEGAIGGHEIPKWTGRRWARHGRVGARGTDRVVRAASFAARWAPGAPFATTWTARAPAEVAVALVTAAPWVAWAAGLAICGADVYGVTLVAVAD